MEKTVVLPTDFSIASLTILKSYLNKQDRSAKITIILLHGMHPNDSITNLLFFSKSRILEGLTNPAFEEALRVLKNKYASQIRIMRKDLFTGFTQASFEQYVQANRISEVCIPAPYHPDFKEKNSFNLLPYLKTSHLKLIQIDTCSEVSMPEQGSVAELFTNRATLD